MCSAIFLLTMLFSISSADIAYLTKGYRCSDDPW